MGKVFNWNQLWKWVRKIIPDGNMQANKMENCFFAGCQSLIASIEKIIMNRVETQ